MFFCYLVFLGASSISCELATSFAQFAVMLNDSSQLLPDCTPLACHAASGTNAKATVMPQSTSSSVISHDRYTVRLAQLLCASSRRLAPRVRAKKPGGFGNSCMCSSSLRRKAPSRSPASVSVLPSESPREIEQQQWPV